MQRAPVEASLSPGAAVFLQIESTSVVTLTFKRLSFRRLSPESSVPPAPESAVGWMPGTSPGMTNAMKRQGQHTSKLRAL
jgi:hypothetical protein